MSYKALDNYVFGTVYRNKILFRGIDTNGHWIDTQVENFPINLYIESKRASDGIGLRGETLKKYSFDSIAEANHWKKDMKESQIKVHGDISPEIMLFRALPKKQAILPENIKTLYYDIETTVTNGQTVAKMVELCDNEITLISTYNNVTKKCHIFLYNDYDINEIETYNDNITSKYEVVYHKHNTESDMLMDFVNYFQEVNPHILSGWNTQGFDNVYIYRRIVKLFGENVAKRLSPFSVIKERTIEVFNKEQPIVDIVGVADYDYLEIYKQYTYHSMPNYKLETVADHHLKCGKLKHDGSFEDFYKNHWNKFIAYNIRDTLLVVELDKAVDLLSVAVSVSYMCGVTLSDTFGTIKKLDALVYQYLSNVGTIIPPTKKEDSESFPGGYVSEPQVGLHRGVVSFDLNSLYPHLIMEYNISPETLVEQDTLPENIQMLCQTISPDKILANEIDFSSLKDTPYIVSPYGVCFDQTKEGILPMIMRELYDGRKASKKKSMKHKQNYLDAKEELLRRGIVV